MLSSDLIKWAELVAIQRWPFLVRAFTYVDASKIRSRYPGYAFQCAGWERTDHRRGRGLHMLQKIFVPDRLFDTLWLTPQPRRHST